MAFSILSMGFKNGVHGVWKVQNAVGTAIASGGKWHEGDDEKGGEEGETVSDATTSTPAPTNAPTGAETTKPVEMAPCGAP